MYAEGVKLAKRYEQEEKELAEKLTVSERDGRNGIGSGLHLPGIPERVDDSRYC